MLIMMFMSSYRQTYSLVAHGKRHPEPRRIPIGSATQCAPEAHRPYAAERGWHDPGSALVPVSDEELGV